VTASIDRDAKGRRAASMLRQTIVFLGDFKQPFLCLWLSKVSPASARGCVRMTVRYRSRRIDDAGLRERLRTLAKERRRFGYRRLHVLLRREGFVVNHKRLFRIYREERLD
jgi:hypothetical protein